MILPINCVFCITLCKYYEFSLYGCSLVEVPTQEDGGREVVNFRVVYKKETLPISFELDQPVSKLKSRIHELTGSVHEGAGGGEVRVDGGCMFMFAWLCASVVAFNTTSSSLCVRVRAHTHTHTSGRIYTLDVVWWPSNE